MSSSMRIGGLASGMDIDQMVADLMKAERMRVDSVRQKRQLAEWQQEDYRTVNNALMTLRTSTISMRLQGSYLAKTASSSNESAFSATASSSAGAGSYNVTVWQLAEGVTRGSQGQLAEERNADNTLKTLKEQFSSLSDTITFTLEGKVGSDGITRNSQTFTIDTTTATIDELVSEINKYSDDLGIKASYDSANNRFFLSTMGTGSDYGINVSADSDGLLSDAGGAGTGQLQLLLKTGELKEGKNALFDFGDVTGMESKTNTASVNGLTLNLKKGAGATGNVTVTSDVDTVYNSIKAFIDQYNSTIDFLNKELNEDRNRDYLPLTDSQREKMSDEQEKLWEEKARSGMLRSDSLLSGYYSKIRTAMSSSKVEGIASVIVDGKTVTHNTLSSLGIVVSLDYRDGGKLYFKNDGADLKKAIETDPEGVMNLFTQNTGVDGEKGIAQRVYDEVNNSIDAIIEKAGFESEYSLYDDSVIGKQLRNFDQNIADWEDRLKVTEDRYWRQFTAMEKAISQMNSQSAWLAQQFGGGQ